MGKTGLVPEYVDEHTVRLRNWNGIVKEYSDGYLAKITYADGKRIELQYDAIMPLQSIVSSTGESLRSYYDTDESITHSG